MKANQFKSSPLKTLKSNMWQRTPTLNEDGAGEGDPFPMFQEQQLKRIMYYCDMQPGSGVRHMFYIINEIMDIQYYVHMIHVIRTMTPQDNAFIYLNSPGGDVDVGMQILNAIDETEGTVTTVLDSKAYSIAAVIFLSGHNKIVQPNSSLMIHNYSATMRGKGHELQQTLQGYNSFIVKMMATAINTFLTEEEMRDVEKGMDLWFNSDQVNERLEKCTKDFEIENLKLEKQSLYDDIVTIEERIEQIDKQLDSLNSNNNDDVEEMEECEPLSN